MKNEYKISDGLVYVKLDRRNSDSIYAIVSTDQLGKLMQLDSKWRVSFSNGKPYVSTNVIKDGKKTTLKLHRFLTNCPDGLVVDHINGNTLDNTSYNLRVCTQSENGQNRKDLNVNNTSGLRGVTFSAKHDKWAASVMVNRKRIHLGLFDDKQMAGQAVEDAMRTHFTEI